MTSYVSLRVQVRDRVKVSVAYMPRVFVLVIYAHKVTIMDSMSGSGDLVENIQKYSINY